LSLERNRWAIAQKTERGLYLLDAEMKDSMKYQNVAPDTWIFPSKMSIYVSMVPSSEVRYQEVGRSSAVADNNDISKAPQSLLTFRGCTVHETRPFDMDFSGAPSELLRREQMIGNYYTMLPHARPAVDDGGYKTDHRSIYIFNMDVDRFEKIHIEDAIENCFRFDDARDGGAQHTVHPAHAHVLYEHGLPTSKDVGFINDPLFCHNKTTDSIQYGDNAAGMKRYLRQNPKPDGVCVVLGDLPLEHFKGSDLRDWCESVKAAAKRDGYGILGGNGTVEAWYYDKFDFSGASNMQSGNANMSNTTVATTASGLTADPDHVDALENAWDPLLIAALHNNTMPVNAVTKSASQLKQAYQSEFPQTWKNLLNTEDVAYARKQVVKGARALIADPRAYTAYLSNANDHYAEHLTDRALSKRSNFIAGGLLEQALSEMQNPSGGSKRTKAAKRVKQFIDNFETTAEYFKRENPELQDNAHVLREILRSYVQPMAASDAQQLEQAVEAKVMNKETITPDMLDALRNQLHTETSNMNLDTISKELEQAAADMKPVGGGDRAADARRRAKVSGDDSTFGRARRALFRRRVDEGFVGNDTTLEYEIRFFDDVEGKSEEDLRLLFMDTKITKGNLLKMAELDIVVPFGFMLTRPFERYDMCSAILCKSGTQLGNTYMGHNDFQLTVSNAL